MLDNLLDERFPVDVAFGARGGPVFNTQTVRLRSGHEQRNRQWAEPLRQYDAGYGIRSRQDLQEVSAFFERCGGQLRPFRWRDPFDYRSSTGDAAISATDQVLGGGDGLTRSFGLKKARGHDPSVAPRPIYLPVEDTIIVAVAGSALPDNQWSWEDGAVSLATPPAVGEIVTAGFEYDIPARFATDTLVLELAVNGGRVPSIPITEVRV